MRTRVYCQYWLFLLLVLGYAHSVRAGVYQRQIPGSSLSLTSEWFDTGSEAEYYTLVSRDDEDDASFVTEEGYMYARSVTDRPGHSTTNHSCDHIRGVPAHLRSASNMRPSGLSTFYQKYTEAYGIPVLASHNVPDVALRRACYVLRFLLADHAGVRQTYYRLSGRVAVIGAQEGTVSIPEHAWLGASWNARARGLGATEHAPVSTGGEENILCYTNDRYYNEDIFLHEFSHGIHLLGAKYAIPGWQSRLQSLYAQAKSTGRWANTYAMSTVEEYFAEGTQSFFSVNAYSSPPNGIHNDVNTHEKLRKYDPQLFNLIQEVFPCGNTYIKRCHTTRNKELDQVLRMDCNQGGTGSGMTSAPVTQAPVTHIPVITTGSCQDNNAYCASWASNGECNTNPSYMHIYCKSSCNLCKGGGNCVDSNSDCTYWSGIGECTRNPNYMLTSCRKSCGQC